MKAMKITMSPKVKSVDKNPVDCTIATMIARLDQAVRSSTAAQVRLMVPRVDLDNPFSCTIRAKTGKAVMLMAIPMNSPNAKKLTPLGAYFGNK